MPTQEKRPPVLGELASDRVAPLIIVIRTASVTLTAHAVT